MVDRALLTRSQSPDKIAGEIVRVVDDPEITLRCVMKVARAVANREISPGTFADKLDKLDKLNRAGKLDRPRCFFTTIAMDACAASGATWAEVGHALPTHDRRGVNRDRRIG